MSLWGIGVAASYLILLGTRSGDRNKEDHRGSPQARKTNKMEEHNQVEDAAVIAIEKTKEAQEAIEAARSLQSSLSDEKIAKALSSALRDVFGENENSGRFIDTNRIPLICQDIKGIHGSISKIEDKIDWVSKLVIGAVILALLGMVLIKVQ